MNDFRQIKDYAQKVGEDIKASEILPEYVGALVVMWTLLSRIPLPKSFWPERMPDGRRTLSTAPLAGGLLGLICALFVIIVRMLGVGPNAAAWFGFVFYAAAGWTFHLDGWSDVWDGLMSGKNEDELRSVMKDSRIGAGGTVALIAAAGLWTGLVSSLHFAAVLPAFIVAASCGRFASCFAAFFGKYPWEEGMGKNFVDGFEGENLFAAFIFTVIFIPAAPVRWFFSAAFAVLIGSLGARYMNGKLGGVNGDVLGACAVAAELAAFAVFMP